MGYKKYSEIYKFQSIYFIYVLNIFFQYGIANKRFIQVSPSESLARPLGAELSIRTT